MADHMWQYAVSVDTPYTRMRRYADALTSAGARNYYVIR